MRAEQYVLSFSLFAGTGDKINSPTGRSLPFVGWEYDRYLGSGGIHGAERRNEELKQLQFTILAALALVSCDSTPASVETDEDGQLYFGDDECTDDCSGHKAGYAWAEEKGITDPEDCGGKSASFVEGSETYAEEQQSE